MRDEEREDTRLPLSPLSFLFLFLLLTHNLSQHRPRSTYSESRIEFDTTHRPHNSVIDVAESEYRSRVQPNYRKEFSVTGTTVDGPRFAPSFKASSHVDEYTVDASSVPTYKESVQVTGTTVDPPAPRSTYYEKVDIVEETVDAPRYKAPATKKSKMGYYDEDGKHDPLPPSSACLRRCRPHTSVLTPNIRPLPLLPSGIAQVG
jgi:hypothetical protein